MSMNNITTDQKQAETMRQGVEAMNALTALYLESNPAERAEMIAELEALGRLRPRLRPLFKKFAGRMIRIEEGENA